MNGPLILGIVIVWLAFDILYATRMAKIEDPSTLQKVKGVFIVVNVLVIVGGLLYLYLNYGNTMPLD